MILDTFLTWLCNSCEKCLNLKACSNNEVNELKVPVIKKVGGRGNMIYFIHLLNKYLLIACYLQGTVGIRNTATSQHSSPDGLYGLMGNRK